MQPIVYDEKVKTKITFSDAGWQWSGDIKDKPEIEQQLFQKQDQFYKTKDPIKKQQVWSEMFTLVQKYSKSLVLKKKKGRKYTEPAEVDNEATQTALSFMSQYIYRPGYHVGASFAGMINPKVLETLYKYNKDDDNYSLNSVLGDSNLELEDMQRSMNFESIYNTSYEEPGEFINNISLKDTLYSVINEFYNEVKDEKIRFKLLSFIQILLRKPKNKHIIPMFLKYIAMDKKEYDLIQLFQLELYKRLNN